MNKKLFNTIQFLIMFLLGAVLVWFSFHKISFTNLLDQLKIGNYLICIPIFAVSGLGYFFRILRWKIMLEGMDEVCRKRSLLAALCMGYGVSFIVPRLGEVSRALIIKKTDGVKVDFTLISIVAERILDTLVLLTLVLINFILFSEYLIKLIDVDVLISKFWNVNPYLLGVIFLLVLVITAAGVFLMRIKWLQVLLRRYKPVFSGLKHSMINLKFWLLTVGIWICYFLMTYLWFFLFDTTSILTWQNALLIMTVGSFGRSIPVQGGGMGAYHFLVSNTFVLLGINLVTGNAMAIVIHGAQAVFTFITAIVGYVWMLIDLRIPRKDSAPQIQ